MALVTMIKLVEGNNSPSYVPCTINVLWYEYVGTIHIEQFSLMLHSYEKSRFGVELVNFLVDLWYKGLGNKTLMTK